MSALLAGATGLNGRELAAQWSGPGVLHLLVRCAVAPRSAPQRMHVVDFAAFPPLPHAELAFCCLGTTPCWHSHAPRALLRGVIEDQGGAPGLAKVQTVEPAAGRPHGSRGTAYRGLHLTGCR